MESFEEDVLGAAYLNVEGSPLLPPHLVTLYFVIFLLLLIVVYVFLHQKKKPIHIAHKLQLLFLTALAIKVFFIAGGGLLAAYWLVPRPEVLSTNPAQNATNYSTTKKIEIIFDRPISRRSLEKSIYPETPGVWTFENSLYTTHFYRKLVFHPQVSLKPNTEYKIVLSNIKNAIKISSPYTYEISFKTQEAPKIAKVEPTNGAYDIDINKPIKITLTQPNDRVSEFDFELTPSTPFKGTLDSSKKSYTLTPLVPLQQGVQYQLKAQKTDLTLNLMNNKVIERGPTTEEYQGTFITRQAPGVESFAPSGTNVPKDSEIKIIFSQKMDKKSVEENLSFSPQIRGALSWLDDNSLVYKPEALEYETTYTVRIAKGIKAFEGSGFLEEDIIKTFSTIGSVKMLSVYPQDGWRGVGVNNEIKVAFDQEVDRQSAQENFSILPDTTGSFDWNDNTLIFKPDNSFSYNTYYTISIGKGVKGKLGLPSKYDFIIHFTTQEQTVKLAVPAYLQQHALSCELAALKMALSFRGVNVSEEDLLSQVGIDNTPHNGNVWGDPYAAFVGNVDGKQMVDGYGVYWGPIAQVAKTYRGGIEFEGWSVSQLTEAILQNNPVVIWVYSKYGLSTSWQTPQGKNVYAVRDEHAVTAVGFVGPASAPSQVIVNDPLIGQVYWPREFFERKWNIFNRSGVVVF